MTKQNKPSWRHHYIPEFYLKRWTSAGELCEYTPIGNNVSIRRRSPRQTGWHRDLYAVRHGTKKDILETGLFKLIDDRAAQVFDILTGEKYKLLDGAQTTALSHFLMSLLLRDPDSIKSMRAKVDRDYPEALRTFQEDYEALRRLHDPDDVVSYFELNDPDISSRFFARILLKSITNPTLANRLSSMSWIVVDIQNLESRFMTSDRPLVITDYGIGRDDSWVAMPLSPTKAMVGVNDPKLNDNLATHVSDGMVKDLNFEVIRQAKKYVYGIDKSQKDFVREYFGNRSAMTLQERMRALPLPFGESDRQRYRARSGKWSA